MFNAMALLGWSYAPEVTIFSREQAVERFELSQVSKNPAVFDIDKLGWINGEYMRALPLERFLEEARPFLAEQLGAETVRSGWDRFVGVAPLIQERMRLFSEVPSMAGFLFEETLSYDEDSWAKVMGGDQVEQVLGASRRHLETVDRWESEQIEAALRAMLDEIGIGARKGLQPLRVAITGSSVSPPLFESMAALGRDATFDRLAAARARLAA
jgi:glutamyl-tRNA synthetase